MVSISRRSLYKKRILRIPGYFDDSGDYYYIVSAENKLIDKYEVEAARILINRELRKFKKKGKRFWVFINYDCPFYKKSTHSRMGKGKGDIDSYKKYVNINTIIFRLEASTLSLVLNIFRVIQSKLSFRIAIYKNGEFIIGSRL